MKDSDAIAADDRDPAEVDIEAIMQEIRQQILAEKEALRPTREAPIPVSGERLPPAFYEHLYQAGLAYDEIDVRLHVTKSDIPLIGPLLDKLRYKAHQLVLFYVNQMATEQMAFNEHVLRAVGLLAQEWEKEGTHSGDTQ